MYQPRISAYGKTGSETVRKKSVKTQISHKVIAFCSQALVMIYLSKEKKYSKGDVPIG